MVVRCRWRGSYYSAGRNLFLTIALLGAGAATAGASPAQAAGACPSQAVTAHVTRQFERYGPSSRDREYFGYIYRHGQAIHSSVIQGTACPRAKSCSVDTARAASQIPPGAKILGEWHTHPHAIGAESLSIEDVRGANKNRHIRCYAPFYSGSSGNVFTWDLNQTSVPSAMASRRPLGNYYSSPEQSPRHDAEPRRYVAIIAAQYSEDRHAFLRVRMPELRLPGRGAAEDL